jgi:hypothetical protein
MDRKFLIPDGRWLEKTEYIGFLETCAESWEKGEQKGENGANMAALIRRRIENLKKEKE